MTFEEIAYSRSGFVRIIRTPDNRFEVQTESIRGASKLGDSSITHWRKLYAVYDINKALRLLDAAT